MTTTVSGRKKAKAIPAAKKSGKKRLRIRDELLPASSIYIAIEGVDYVALPVDGYADWYEGIEDRSVAEYADGDAVARLQGVRKKVLPSGAKKLTIEKTRYHAVPVADFAEWYEDIGDRAVCRYAHENPEPAIPFEEAFPKRGRSG